MGLTEKTLELNVTHEILSQADQLQSLFIALVRARRFQWSGFLPPLPRHTPTAAIGLSLDDESRRGWDVRIDLPHPYFEQRCIFVQYKLGKHLSYSKHDG